MRISDWSSAVCSSDLMASPQGGLRPLPVVLAVPPLPFVSSEVETPVDLAPSPMALDADGWEGPRRLPVVSCQAAAPRGARPSARQTGRATCRGTVVQDAKISVVAAPLKKQTQR